MMSPAAATLALLSVWFAAAENSPSDYPRHQLLGFHLTETEAQLTARFSKPPVRVTGPGHTVLQFHNLPPEVAEEGLPTEWLTAASASCDGRFAYVAYFNDRGELLSVLHQPERRLPSRVLFPEGSFREVTVTGPMDLETRHWVRTLEGGRVLVASFYSPARRAEFATKFLDQVLLVRRSDLRRSLPTLAAALGDAE